MRVRCIWKRQKEVRMKLKVLNLPVSMHPNELKKLFAEVGTVKSVYLIPDEQHQIATGYVTMTNHKQHQQALKVMNGRMVDGRAIEVQKSSRRNMHDTQRLLKSSKIA